MRPKRLLPLIAGMALVTVAPSAGLCWYGPPPYYHHHHHGNAVFWGLSGLIIGTAVTAAVLQPPPVQRVVYASPPPPPPTPVYTNRPEVPPGMCRWERFVLDGYGRYVYDQYGQPVKEYTIGSCQAPPY